jgi:hypothetical protein
MLKQVGLPGFYGSPLIGMLRGSSLTGWAASCSGRGVSVVVYCSLVDVVWNVGVSSGGVLMMGIMGIIVLHTLRRGEPELSPSLKDE